ncbi:lactococcin family bacteriocin [Streptococcus suis]|uniref:lactococcin family bacteriocin n=1 Tax=Streptococcus suis TaxID=1307 RepID=UPI00115D7B39|nr:lactococcin family bacteriocin [Streptococcus suis]
MEKELNKNIIVISDSELSTISGGEFDWRHAGVCVLTGPIGCLAVIGFHNGYEKAKRGN